MPMAAVEHFGTNSNNSPNRDYCCFCYKQGEFTDNLDFDEFVEDNLKFHNEADRVDGRTLTRDELRIKTRTKLPALKRWSSHRITHQEYYRSVNSAVDYINAHLSEPITLNNIASVVNISGFHFHRIFRAVMNESIGDYIQRLRLEKASFKLQTTKLPLVEIAGQTGYQTPHALSKAFKKRYGVSPSAFRAHPSDYVTPMSEPMENMCLKPEIRALAPKDVIYTRVVDPFGSKDAFIDAWDRLIGYAQWDGIPDEEHEYLCLSRDISTITNPEHYRAYACISTSRPLKPQGKFGVQTIEGGLYAVFRHKGAYRDLKKVYCNIYRYWMPKSEYTPRDVMSFEKYLNSPDFVCEDDLLTEVYVPVEKCC